MTETKVCLTIAGLDPSGGAGIIADIRTFASFGCFATAAIASITFQNTVGVFGAVHQTPETLRGQVEPILKDFFVDAVKTGMLPTRGIIEETARLINENSLPTIVVDPVVRSTSGFDLIDEEALMALIEVLFPISTLVTPNIQEAERIGRMSVRSHADIEKAAKIIRSMGAENVLIKGGHFEAETVKNKKARDYLFTKDGETMFENDYIDTTATHGTGCTLAAAIAANLAIGKTLENAVSISKNFVNEAIRTAPMLGHGNSPINIPNRYREEK